MKEESDYGTQKIAALFDQLADERSAGTSALESGKRLRAQGWVTTMGREDHVPDEAYGLYLAGDVVLTMVRRLQLQNPNIELPGDLLVSFMILFAAMQVQSAPKERSL